MKVVYLISTLDVGGAESMLVNLVNALPPEVEPVIVALRDRTALAHRLANPRVRLLTAGLEGRVDPGAWLRVASILRRERPDVIHSHMLLSNWGSRFLAPLCGAVVINHEHGISRWKNGALRAVDRATQRLADRIIVVSEASRRERVERVGLDPSRIVVIHNAIDVGVFGAVERRAQDGEPAIWGVVARLDPIKRVEMALEIAAAARRAGHPLKLRIAGDGPERPRLEQIADRLDLGDAVEFLGTVSDIVGFYSSIDVFLLTSELEDCPVTVLEALASGRFVAATAVGGVPELLDGAADALLIGDADTPEAVAKQLATIGLAFDSSGNRSHAAAYDVSRYVERLMGLYREVLGKGQRG